MSRDDLTALIERVEAATGPDREVDAEIACAMCRFRLPTHTARPDPIAPGRVRDCVGGWVAPTYTASLDAALTLVPSGFDWLLDSGRIAIVGRRPAGPFTARAATPALALTAAALRARLAQMGDDA